MKPRSFIALAVVTAIFVVAAIWSVGSQRGLTSILSRDNEGGDLLVVLP